MSQFIKILNTRLYKEELQHYLSYLVRMFGQNKNIIDYIQHLWETNSRISAKPNI